MAELREREPLTTAEDPDEDVGSLDSTLDEHYRAYALDKTDVSADLDDAPCSDLRRALPKNAPTSPGVPPSLSGGWNGPFPPTFIAGLVGFPNGRDMYCGELAELAEKRNADLYRRARNGGDRCPNGFRYRAGDEPISDDRPPELWTHLAPLPLCAAYARSTANSAMRLMSVG